MKTTLKMIQELRRKTGIGIMECKKALLSAEGNFEQALFNIKKLGKMKVLNNIISCKSGIISISQDSNKILMIEVRSNTDFTILNDEFNNFINLLLQDLIRSDVVTLNDALSLILSSGDTICDAFKKLSLKFNEDIFLKKICVMYGSNLGFYNHFGRVAAIVSLDIDSYNIDLLKNIAMHIVACNPLAISPMQISNEIVEQEKNYIIQSYKNKNNIVPSESIINKYVNKFLYENSLLNQYFVKNTTQKIYELLDEYQAKIKNFVRFALDQD